MQEHVRVRLLTTTLCVQMSDASEVSTERDAVKARSSRRRRRRKFAVVFFIGLVILALVATGSVYFYANRIVGQVDRIPDAFEIPDAQRPADESTGDLNILLAGSDARASGASASEWAPGASRTDAIMLLHIDADRESAQFISIPRDSWVTIPGVGKDKINAAFSLGGPSLYVSTVEKLTGVRIDHLALVDFKGFEQITDALGGVDITVAESGCGERAGRQSMDGAEALRYVRQRSCLARGDFDRVQRQQRFLRSILRQTMAGGVFRSPGELNGVLNAMTRNLSVDGDWARGDMLRLAYRLRGLRPDDMTFLTAPLAEQPTGRESGASVVYLDPHDGRRLWRAVRRDDVGTYLAQDGSRADVLQTETG